MLGLRITSHSGPPAPALEREPALAGGDPGAIEVSIVMPCLNEIETLGQCIRKAQLAIAQGCLRAEIVIADNGSSDGSQALAESLGARVVHAAEKGYGNALRAGIAAARGRYVVMGDADDSYDFATISGLIDQLRAGFDLVMGNRFRGGIAPGAMPWKHRYLGNPVLTGIGRLFFRATVGDFHCGLRGFSRAAYDAMQLRTTGMEFASEMVIKASLKKMRVTEVPVVLHKDGRSRPPHLRTWSDGWRHLRFMLLFSPRWLFLTPGVALFALGAVIAAWLLPAPRVLGGVVLDIHTLLVAAFLCIVGYQLVIFGTFTKIFAIQEGLHPPDEQLDRVVRFWGLERAAIAGVLLLAAGVAALALALWSWEKVGFGNLDPRITMRPVIAAVALMTLGVQTVFASFFLGVLELPRR